MNPLVLAMTRDLDLEREARDPHRAAQREALRQRRDSARNARRERVDNAARKVGRKLTLNGISATRGRSSTGAGLLP
jgi:hypothetical protein